MLQCLPTEGFKWLSEKKVQQINLAMYTNNSAKGLILILEVDLEYPSSLHKLHNDHPFAAENLKVTEEMLSRYWVTIRKKYKISIGQVKKLIPTMSSKERYVLHYRNLQLYLNLRFKSDFLKNSNFGLTRYLIDLADFQHVVLEWCPKY